MRSDTLQQRLVAAGRQAGLFKAMARRKEEPEQQDKWLLTEPIVFTLRPVEDYMRHFWGDGPQ